MFKELLNLSKHTAIYGFGQVASRGVAVLLIPLYTAYLTPENYGLLQITRVYNSLFLVFILLGMQSAMFRVYYKTDSLSERNIITNSTFIAYIVFSTVIFSPIMLLLSNFSNILISTPESAYVLWLVFISVFLEGFYSLQLAVLRAEEKSKTYSIISLIKVLIYIGLTILFVVHFKKDFIGVIQAGIISLIIIDLIMIPLTMSNFKLEVSIPYLRDILKIGIPLAVSGLGVWVLNLSDRYMIQYLLPESIAMSQVGIYSLGDKLAQLIRFLIVVPFMLTWGAMMYSFEKKPNAKQIYRKVLHIFFFIATLMAFFFSLFSKEIIMIISQNDAYNSAYIVVPLLSFSKVLTGVIFIISVGVIITNKSKYVAFASFVAAILNVFVNFLLIPQYGIIGASAGSFIAYLINVAILYHFAQKFYYIPYEIDRVLIYGLVIFLISVLSVYLKLHFSTKCLIFFIIMGFSPASGLVSFNNIKTGLLHIKMKLFG